MNQLLKNLLAAGCLLGGSTLGFSQTKTENPGAELTISYLRGTQKLHDLQASPMIYYTTYNGINLDYKRITEKNRWEFGLEAKTGNMIAPELGEREFQIEEGGDSFVLIPSQYFGEIRAGYQRKVSSNSEGQGFLGVMIRDEFFYADGLAMNTWSMNNLEFAARYSHFMELGERHRIEGDVILPLFAFTARTPYSNVVSQPDKSQSKAFLEESEFTSLVNYQHPEIQLSYRYSLARRSGLEFRYSFDWMHYSEPRSIKKSNHEIALAWVYVFQFSHQ